MFRYPPHRRRPAIRSSNCSTSAVRSAVHSVVHGCLLTSAKGPIAPGGPIIGNKEGRACGWNILSLFAWGDLHITTAMKNAGITQISSVDSHAFELVPGFYGINRYCTVVSGR